MSLQIREPKWEDGYEDQDCAKCDRTRNIAATIVAEHVKIFVCEDCLHELQAEITECLDLAAKRCEKCTFFLGDKYDWVHYSGRCTKRNRDTDHGSSCPEFEKRQGKMQFQD